MESTLSKILNDFCYQYNLEKSQVEPIIKKLNQEFYFRLKDMKHLTIEKWKNLKLPDNLFNILEEKYNENLELGNNNENNNDDNELENNEFKNLNIIKESSFSIGIGLNEFKNIIKKIEENPINLNELEKNLNSLEIQINNNEKAIITFKIIGEIINNIITHPNDEKYKKININKILQKYPYNEIENIFNTIQFIKVPDSSFIKYNLDIKFLSEPYSIIINKKNNIGNSNLNNVNQDNNNIENVNNNQKETILPPSTNEINNNNEIRKIPLIKRTFTSERVEDDNGIPSYTVQIEETQVYNNNNINNQNNTNLKNQNNNMINQNNMSNKELNQNNNDNVRFNTQNKSQNESINNRNNSKKNLNNSFENEINNQRNNMNNNLTNNKYNNNQIQNNMNNNNQMQNIMNNNNQINNNMHNNNQINNNMYNNNEKQNNIYNNNQIQNNMYNNNQIQNNMYNNNQMINNINNNNNQIKNNINNNNNQIQNNIYNNNQMQNIMNNNNQINNNMNNNSQINNNKYNNNQIQNNMYNTNQMINNMNNNQQIQNNMNNNNQINNNMYNNNQMMNNMYNNNQMINNINNNNNQMMNNMNNNNQIQNNIYNNNQMQNNINQNQNQYFYNQPITQRTDYQFNNQNNQYRMLSNSVRFNQPNFNNLQNRNMNIAQSQIINPNDNNNINQNFNYQNQNQNAYNNEEFEMKSIPELLIDETQRRNKIILETKINHNPKCFFLTSIKNVENLLKKYSTSHQYKENNYSYNDFIRNVIYNQTNDLNRKESNKLRELIDLPIITQGDCFFIFPDKYVIKGIFCLYEKVSEMYDYIRHYLNNLHENFHLYLNNNQIDLMNEDILSMNFNFPVAFKVVFPKKYSGLNENELNKLGVSLV